MRESSQYLAKKSKLAKVLTIYGRNAVYEALLDRGVVSLKLHLASSNKKAKIIDDMLLVCSQENIEVVYHDKLALSRISKNAKQDQGVALDIKMDNFFSQEEFISLNASYRLLAIDGVSNPQNLGMIIRSAAAGKISGIIISAKGTSSINPLVVKASAGTIFKIPIIQTANLVETLKYFQASKGVVYTLSLDAKKSYKQIAYSDKSIFVLGNETHGVSKEIQSICNKSIVIPMNRGVESLNVAMSASILAFCLD
ncbi:MAG TPA: RNA methyltransferase [Epsilonproteobacteria bacterium]|nr:RNA methyltransferase [Campylobacterota bacterium]